MSYNLDTFDSVKAQLRAQKDVGAIKQDLYTHLTEIFSRIMLHHQNDAFDKFEEISHLVKRTYLKIRDPKQDSEVNLIKDAKKDHEKDAWISKNKDLLKEVFKFPPAFRF